MYLNIPENGSKHHFIFISAVPKERSPPRSSKFPDESNRKRPADDHKPKRMSFISDASSTGYGSNESGKSDNRLYPDLNSSSLPHQDDNRRITRSAAKQRKSSQSKY
jgi:hypothetical protein